jgi:hypothetical protein
MDNYNNEINQPRPTQYIRIPERKELIFNFWLVFNECGVLISKILAKEYLATGSRRDKWNLLCDRASSDIELSKEFDIPKQYYVKVPMEDGTEMEIPYLHTSMLRYKRKEYNILTSAIKEIRKQYKGNPDVYIDSRPLYNATWWFDKLENVSDCPLYKKIAMNINRTDI